MVEHLDGASLRYPLYLDVPMMISFLAAIEDGVSFDATVSQKSGSNLKNARGAEGRVKLPSFLSLLGVDVQGHIGTEKIQDSSEEIQLVRRHTEASLFNRLRNVLLDGNCIHSVSKGQDISGLTPGCIIEVSGVVARNPVEELLVLLEKVLSLTKIAGDPAGRGSTGKPNAKPTQSPGALANNIPKEIKQLAEWLRTDLEGAEMNDTVLEFVDDGGKPFTCILTLSKDYGTGRSFDSLLGAELAVLGKITKNVGRGDEINLLRRSTLGYMQTQIMTDMFEQITRAGAFNISLRSFQVSGPCLQILPLAIFI